MEFSYWSVKLICDKTGIRVVVRTNMIHAKYLIKCEIWKY